MGDETTTIAGIEIPSADPLFLAIVTVHIALGIASVVAGAVAMLSAKAPGRHPTTGTFYYWMIVAVVATASALSFMRWVANAHLFVLGVLTLTAAHIGRQARRRRWPNWTSIHIIGMGTSYILLLTAFYVDNGKQLPLWKDLPHWTYWTLPALVGAPLVAWALLRHPLMRCSRDGPAEDP